MFSLLKLDKIFFKKIKIKIQLTDVFCFKMCFVSNGIIMGRKNMSISLSINLFLLLQGLRLESRSLNNVIEKRFWYFAYPKGSH